MDIRKLIVNESLITSVIIVDPEKDGKGICPMNNGPDRDLDLRYNLHPNLGGESGSQELQPTDGRNLLGR